MSRFSLFLCFVFSWSCSVQSTKKQTSGSKHERCSVKCLHGSGVVAHRDLRSCSAPAAADAEIKVPMVRLYMMIFNTRDTTYSCQHVWIIRMFQTGTDSICSSKDSLQLDCFHLMEQTFCHSGRGGSDFWCGWFLSFSCCSASCCQLVGLDCTEKSLYFSCHLGRNTAIMRPVSTSRTCLCVCVCVLTLNRKMKRRSELPVFRVWAGRCSLTVEEIIKNCLEFFVLFVFLQYTNIKKRSNWNSKNFVLCHFFALTVESEVRQH